MAFAEVLLADAEVEHVGLLIVVIVVIVVIIVIIMKIMRITITNGNNDNHDNNDTTTTTTTTNNNNTINTTRIIMSAYYDNTDLIIIGLRRQAGLRARAGRLEAQLLSVIIIKNNTII